MTPVRSGLCLSDQCVQYRLPGDLIEKERD